MQEEEKRYSLEPVPRIVHDIQRLHHIAHRLLDEVENVVEGDVAEEDKSRRELLFGARASATDGLISLGTFLLKLQAAEAGIVPPEDGQEAFAEQDMDILTQYLARKA